MEKYVYSNNSHSQQIWSYFSEFQNSFLKENGHCLTNIIVAWDEFKPVFHPEFFLGIMVHISTVF